MRVSQQGESDSAYQPLNVRPPPSARVTVSRPSSARSTFGRSGVSSSVNAASTPLPMVNRCSPPSQSWGDLSSKPAGKTNDGSVPCVCGELLSDGAGFCHNCGNRHHQDSHAQVISLFREAMGVICEDISQATREMTLLRQDLALGMSGVSSAVQSIQRQTTKCDTDPGFVSAVQEEFQRLHAKLDSIEEKRHELDVTPIIAALEQNNSMHKTIQQIKSDIDDLVLQERSSSPDFSSVIEAVQCQRLEVDFEPIIDAIQKQYQQCVVDIDGVANTMDTIIRQMMIELRSSGNDGGLRLNPKSDINLPQNVELATCSLGSSASKTSIASIQHAMQQDNDDVELLPHIKALQRSKVDADFTPVIAAIQNVKTADDLAPIVRSIQRNRSEVDILPVIHAIEQNTSTVDFAPVIAAVQQNKTDTSLMRTTTLIQQKRNENTSGLFGRLK